MENSTKKQGSIIAILAMIFLFAMIAFVTNLCSPMAVILKNAFNVSETLGQVGNYGNFGAYLLMGIPSGLLIQKFGYKKTALAALVVGIIGLLVQWISGEMGFIMYLIGAFISGLCMCMLNAVVNPMLNLLGGGGNRGNQLNLIGGTLNSLSGTLTPMFVGALVGTVTASTTMTDVNLVLYIAMAVFAAAYVILTFVPIKDPEMGKTTSKTVFEHSPWAFRHCVLGVIAIFVYVGVEVGIPGTMIFYLSDTSDKGGGLVENAAAIAGFVAGTYWLLMLVGRFVAGFIADKISSRTMMLAVTSVAMVLILLAMVTSKDVTVAMPLFTGSSFETKVVPLSAMFLVLCGLCTSVMWASIFNLATEGLGKYTAQASGIFMMMVVGGGVLPLVQNFIADHASYMISYIVPFLGVAYMFYYALIGCKNVNKDIPVE